MTDTYTYMADGVVEMEYFDPIQSQSLSYYMA